YTVLVPDEATVSSVRAQVALSLVALTDRERSVLCLRYGLTGQRPLTTKIIGLTFPRARSGEGVGVDRERIRQLEAKALRKLRHPARAKHLLPFVVCPTAPPAPATEAAPH